MNDQYKGTIVEESLEDNRLVNNLNIIGFRISKDENPKDRWHLYTVLVSKSEIERISNSIKPRWYAHFWKGRNIIAIFKDKTFEFNYDHKETWKEAVNHGLSIGIPAEQLDFVIE